MKTSKQIENEIKRKAQQIEQTEKEINKLSFTEERHRIFTETRNIAAVKELREKAAANEEKIKALCKKIPLLKIQIAIIQENKSAAIVAEHLPKITEILKKYNGKKYGEKTREKVYKEAKENGFTFYFPDNKTISLQPLVNGYAYGNENRVTINTHSATPFITDENILRFDPLECVNPYRYTENPAKAAGEIIKAFEKMRKAAETAEALQSNYNSMLPRTMPQMHKISKYNDIFHPSTL